MKLGTVRAVLVMTAVFRLDTITKSVKRSPGYKRVPVNKDMRSGEKHDRRRIAPGAATGSRRYAGRSVGPVQVCRQRPSWKTLGARWSPAQRQHAMESMYSVEAGIGHRLKWNTTTYYT